MAAVSGSQLFRVSLARSRPSLRPQASSTILAGTTDTTSGIIIPAVAGQQQQQVRWLAAAAKKKKKKGAGGRMQNTGGRSKELTSVLAALDAPIRKEPPIDDAERERRHRIGRNYVIGKFEQHNDLHHDLACKIQLKKHALNMLPKNTKLREEALKLDDSAPPLWRDLPMWTPPIPGFDPSEFVEKDE